MTTALPAKIASTIPARTQSGGSAASTAAASIDVVKILKKYMWLLIGAAIFGAILGTALHFLFMRIYPIYQPAAVFQCLPPQTELGETAWGNIQWDAAEQERFMATEVATMKSESMIQKIATEPSLQASAPKWFRKFVEDGRYRPEDAAEWLYDHLKARVEPGTDYIELSCGWTDREDITAIVGLARETYLRTLSERKNAVLIPQKTAMERRLREIRSAIEDKQNQRDLIMRSEEIDSLEQRYAEANQSLLMVVNELNAINTQIEAAKTQLLTYEQELQGAGGITYSADLIAAVEASGLIQSIQQTISTLETQIDAMKRDGYGEEHRDVRRAQQTLDSWRSQLEVMRQRLLRKQFDAMVDGMRNALNTLAAQGNMLATRRTELLNRLIDMSKTLVKITDIERQINELITDEAETSKELEDLRALDNLQSSSRVIVTQPERIPDRPAFPQIIFMVPGGVILVLAFTTGTVFLRELLDQRVRGPADISLIPRTRLLGMVPDASEDSIVSKVVGTAFRDAATGIIAESYRQIRAPLLKQAEQAGHRTIMVLPGMPGSGASSVVGNLALACASADRRVLIIDANFRRPSQHKLFGLPEAPGLADALSGSTPLDSAIRPTSVPNLSLLSSGTPKERIVERLATDAMSTLLAAAAAEYDLVLIDVPPAIVAGDGMAIANRCDATILVVKALQEKRGLVSRLRAELGESRAEFLGVVVNSVRAAAGGYFKRNIKASRDYQMASK